MTDIQQAAARIRSGGLVAFPTETVYGLGANALDAAAVATIFEAKGRPTTSPLIVHVPSVEAARELALEWPDAAEILSQAFWPGPLTLVVRKRLDIPDIVTAGLDTVGLRVPAHPMALDFLRACGVPVAAPSANRFTELSPVSAQHVRESLGDAAGMILDGGACQVGIESTVLSVAGGRLVLLRPGIVSTDDIEALVGPVERAPEAGQGEAHASPGQHRRHYRPRKPLHLVDAGDALPSGNGVLLSRDRMPATAAEYAARLYGTLHELDHRAIDWIAIERPPAGPAWEAIHDRLSRAATV